MADLPLIVRRWEWGSLHLTGHPENIGANDAIEDERHFIWEDAADDYAALVRAWWDGGYEGMREDFN